LSLTLLTLAVVFLLMLAELWLSRANERELRAQGAVEPADDVYALMAWSYPASFLAMGVEGMIVGGPRREVMWAGIATFVAAKAIKYWAIGSLGRRWTFRVLVPPGTPLVTRGPYAWMRHPNYLAVIGELAGVALIAGAAVSGVVASVGFIWLVRRRIVIEDRALGRDQAARKGV
jgi:methyltransferase